MDEDRLFRTINFATRRFSIFIVSPRPVLLEKIDHALRYAARSSPKLASNPFFDDVWIVPHFDEFGAGELDSFIANWKPKLLTEVCNSFGLTPEALGFRADVLTFNKYCELSIKYEVGLLSDLAKVSPGL